jgi:hypothetical protein
VVRKDFEVVIRFEGGFLSKTETKVDIEIKK